MIVLVRLFFRMWDDRKILADGVGGGGGVEGRAGWRGWTKLPMARPPDDDGTEAYIDEAATII